MHPAHAIEAALADYPATHHDLVDAIDPDAGLTYFPVRDNPDERAIVNRARDLITAGNDSGAHPLDLKTRAWRINWSRQDLHMLGHIYTSTRNINTHIAADSPIVLYHRFTLKTFYGQELIDLAYKILGNTLAYEALTEE